MAKAAKKPKPKPIATAGTVVAQRTNSALNQPVRIAGPNGTWIPVSEWDFGYGKGVLQPPNPSAAAAAPPAAAPAAAAAPATPPKPFDFWDTQAGDSANTVGAITGLHQNFSNQIGALDTQEKETWRRMGVTPLSVADPVTGRMFSLDLGTSNPYAESAMLKRDFDDRLAGSRNTAGHTLVDGIQGVAEGDIGFRRLGAYDSLVNRAGDYKSANDTTRATLYGNALSTVSGWRAGDAANAALAVPPEPVAAAPTSGVPGVSAPAPAGPSSGATGGPVSVGGVATPTTAIGSPGLGSSIKGQEIKIKDPKTGKMIPLSQWDFGWGKGVLYDPNKPRK